MTNINSGQFFNNFANNFNQLNTNNIANTQQTQANPAPQVQHEPYIAELILPNTAAQLNQTAAELAMLNQQQTINMLKELFNMPKNFEQLLSQLTTNPQNENQNTALMLLASTLNMSQLSTLIQNNSKEAMTNLYKMLAQFNQLGLSIKDEQMAEISKLISFVSASSSSDVQSLKTLMLMYLPWLPLTDPNAFKLEIASKTSDNESDSQDNITVLISTINYGNIKADIYKTSEDGIKIELASSETFPIKEFDILMKEESKKYSININMLFTKKAAFNKKNDQTKMQVTMNTSPGVNPFLLVISSAVIKNVHVVDEKENLRETRKEKL